MLFTFIKVAFRNMQRNITYSFINVAGLAIGMAACILIILWVQDELSYDRFHKNANTICRVVENQFYSGDEPFPVAVTPHPLAEALKDEFPEVLNSVKLQFMGGTLKYKEKKFLEPQNILLTDGSFFDIFTFPFIKGNPQTALANSNSIVLTEKMAEKYFPAGDPIGKIINFQNKKNLKVTGVIENVPDNSHLRFDFVVPIGMSTDLIRAYADIDTEGWGTNCIYTYIQLQPGSSYQDVSKKISGTIQKYFEHSTTKIFLQPLTKIHLYSDRKYTADIAGHGNIFYVELFSTIGIFIIIIACINFINLTTAKSENRAKEIGMRKVIGANNAAIIRQFLGEAIIFSMLALLFALVLVELFLPLFNSITLKNFSITSGISFGIFSSLFVFALVIGILSGWYPAFFLSSFRPATALKGLAASGRNGKYIRKTLVIFQFCLSIVLIIGTVVVYKQLDYIHSKELGLDKENIIFIPLDDSSKNKYNTIKAEFLNLTAVDTVAVTSALPTNMVNSTSAVSWDGRNPDETLLFHNIFVDQAFAETFRMEILEGRFFSEDIQSDSNTLVINEEAAKIIGQDAIIGKKVYAYGIEFKIIGVLKNFHFKPLDTIIEPIILFFTPSLHQLNFMLLRIKAENAESALASIENRYSQISPESIFTYHFLDDIYIQLYRGVEKAGSVLMSFTILAIFISCLGLYGLVSFISEQRTKEIGVRKVLGASTRSVVMLLSVEFIKCVLIASLIAWPVAYFAMSIWLENYAYRIDMSLWFFVAPAIIALVIAITTVSCHAIKAALADPVKALKYE
jgi:ABC-type antimicrobial peptide transport system permease subunit